MTACLSIIGRVLVFAASSIVLIPAASSAQNGSSNSDSPSIWSFGGHSKYQYTYTGVPDDSVLQAISGDSLQSHSLEVRLKISARRDRWDLDTHVQFITVHSDMLNATAELPGLILAGSAVTTDKRRWFDLTHEIHNENKNATLLRLDRVSVGYTGDKTVFRFGRQAISWGNGLLFTPMDIFNPFDPAAVDREYKAGDDMVYGQYLLDNGNDVQAVAVIRRDLISGEVEQDKSSLALKFHGFKGAYEYDVLAARHYDDQILGLGLSTDFAGAIWRGDLVWADTDTESVFSAVAGASYSWVSGDRNWTGFLEYFYNGFGQQDGEYSPRDLATNPELLKRLARGELFNLGRHYLGASVTVELTPLLNLTPNVFINVTDPSALAQLVLAYDWKQDLQLLAALNVPIGPSGSEYGGINSTQPGLYVSTGSSIFAQLAWYF